MASGTYELRRGQLEAYFDRTAAQAWSRLTSDAKLGRIRATVRAGRDAMRETLLGWLPGDLRGCRVLDAGCGTGALAVAVDLSGTLLALARERAPRGLPGTVEFQAGDMLDPALGRFDYAVAMDSLIHYPVAEAVRALSELAGRTEAALLFTFAPRTPALAAMHAVGRLFPKGDRAPSIEPVGEGALRCLLGAEPALAGWRTGRTGRVATGFYISQALELVRA